MGLFDFLGPLNQAVFQPAETAALQDALHNARDTQTKQYDVNKGYQQPYYEVGTGAMQRLNTNLQNGAYNVNVTPQNLSQDPGYQFQLQQGQQALQRSSAAQGSRGGGGFAKALDNYSQGLASTQYQNAWNRQFHQNQFNYNSLANMAGMGERAGNNLTNLGQNYGNTMASYDMDKGNIDAAGMQGTAQSAGAAEGGLLNSVAQFDMMGMGISGGGGGLGSLAGLGGGGGGGAPSASGAYAANPQNYSLGGYGNQLQIGGGQSMGGIGYDTSAGGYMQPPQAIPQQGFGAYGGGYSLGNYGAQLMPPQEGGGY